MKPYFQKDGQTIYHGDCLDIMPELEPVDLVLTDPPYEGYSQFNYVDLNTVPFPKCKGLIFYKSKFGFPLPYTAKHEWIKGNSHNSSEYIYEINGSTKNQTFKYGCINSIVSASMLHDKYWQHPTQKPIKLIKKLLAVGGDLILDPFMGSGTTLVAAKQLNRKAIGIEIEEKYCEIAAKRIDEIGFGLQQIKNGKQPEGLIY